MTSIRFITFTDVHISSLNPQSRLGDYCEDILDKLKQIKLVGEKLKVDFFLFGGDLFNLKAPMRNPHSLNSKLIELFRSFPATIYATEGNHDLRFDSYGTFDDQPLNVIYKSGAMTQVRDVSLLINDIKINIRGFPFTESPDFGSLLKANKKDYDVSICNLHVYSTPKGGNLFKHKLYSYDEIATLGDDIFLLGHYHIDQGIIKRGTPEQMFINVGSISRGSLAEDELTRNPKIALVTVTKDNGVISTKGQAVKLNVKPAEEVFDLDKKKEEKKKIEEAEIFVEKLRTDGIEETAEGTDRVDSEMEKLKLDRVILDRVKDFLTRADVVLKENS